jgi:hypothetical protein
MTVMTSNVVWKKLAFLFFFFLFGLYVSSPDVAAFGVSPGKLIVNYTPNEEIDVSFYTYNGDVAPMYVRMRRGTGDLNQYVLCDLEDELHEVPPEMGYYFSCTMTLPDGLEPGPHVARHGIVLVKPGEESTIKVEQVVLTRVEVTVPYPRKYIEVEWNFPDVLEGQNVPYTISLKSLGTEEIFDAVIMVDVDNHAGEQVLSTTFDPFGLVTNEEKIVESTLSTSSLPGGIYNLTITANYDGLVDKYDEQLVLGNKMLYISSFPEATLLIGEISKLQFNVKSNWVEDIQGYADVVLQKDGIDVHNVQTDTQTISPAKEATLSAFVESDEGGMYDAVVTTHVSEGVSYTQTFEAVITVEKKGAWLPYTIVAVVLLAIVVGGIVLLRKRKDAGSSL